MHTWTTQFSSVDVLPYELWNEEGKKERRMFDACRVVNTISLNNTNAFASYFYSHCACQNECLLLLLKFPEKYKNFVNFQHSIRMWTRAGRRSKWNAIEWVIMCMIFSIRMKNERKFGNCLFYWRRERRFFLMKMKWNTLAWIHGGAHTCILVLFPTHDMDGIISINLQYQKEKSPIGMSILTEEEERPNEILNKKNMQTISKHCTAKHKYSHQWIKPRNSIYTQWMLINET